MQISSVIEPQADHDKQLKAALGRVLDFCKPKILDPRIKGNAITELEKNYQKNLISLKEFNIHAENFTIFEMICAFEQKTDDATKMQAEIDKMKNKQG